MTLEEAILARSYLPQNGTHTLQEHILAMLMEVQGTEVKIDITELEETVVIDSNEDSVLIDDRTERVIVTDTPEEIIEVGI